VSQTADAVARRSKPDALITIDSPEFSLRVAAKVKARAEHMPTIHYVAPTVWAWRAKRARKMAKSIDHVLALFPFEPPYMKAEGMSCDFVGHPVTTEPVASGGGSRKRFARRARDRRENAPLICWSCRALAGPRSIVSPPSSARRCARSCCAHPDARRGPAHDRNRRADSRRQIEGWPVAPLSSSIPRGPTDGWRILAEKRAAFAAADVALAASGTVSLELAAAETPMVVAYDMSWMSRKIIGAMLKVDTVTLVNLVSDTRAVPEFLGPDCKPIADCPCASGSPDG
jgi:lipid-A-disaccharide synthase